MAIGHKNRKEANHIILDVLITHCSKYLFAMAKYFIPIFPLSFWDMITIYL